jgi:hypothetical protein
MHKSASKCMEFAELAVNQSVFAVETFLLNRTYCAD